jgi:hypothetical protein
MKSNVFRKGVFISFCWDDKDLMERVRKALSKSEVLYPVVITAAERANARLLNTEKVEEGLLECDYFVPILTQNSLNNQWVNQEIGFAAALRKDILPIIQTVLLKEKLLKGWVNTERDLPYQFEPHNDPKKARKIFRERGYKPLIKNLEIENKVIIYNHIPESKKSKLKTGQIIYYNNDSRHFRFNGVVHSLQNSDVYKSLMKLVGNKEIKGPLSQFRDWPKGRSIK